MGGGGERLTTRIQVKSNPRLEQATFRIRLEEEPKRKRWNEHGIKGRR